MLDRKEMNQVKKTLRSLLLSNKNGVPVSDLQSEYRNVVGGSGLPLTELGYPDLLSLLQVCTQTRTVLADLTICLPVLFK